MIREPSKIKTYLQPDRSPEWLKDNPHEWWRCDIFPADGSDHRGIGATEAEALMNATMAYLRWTGKHTPPPSSEVQLHTHMFGDTRPHQSEVDHRVDFQYHRIGRD